MRRELPRFWVVMSIGDGFGLRHSDQYGMVQEVTPSDPVNGDTLEDCRLYFGTYAKSYDLLFEPHRVFQKFPGEHV